MVFQDPTSSLHPMLTIERQLTEHVAWSNLRWTAPSGPATCTGALEEVRMPDPEAALRSYRISSAAACASAIQIAMALACEPSLLIGRRADHCARRDASRPALLRLMTGSGRTTGPLRSS